MLGFLCCVMLSFLTSRPLWWCLIGVTVVYSVWICGPGWGFVCLIILAVVCCVSVGFGQAPVGLRYVVGAWGLWGVGCRFWIVGGPRVIGVPLLFHLAVALFPFFAMFFVLVSLA